MDILEVVHLGGSAAGLMVALYVGKSMSQLKIAILDQVKRDYVSKEVAQVEKEALETLMTSEKVALAQLFASIERHQTERHEANKTILKSLTDGHSLIHRRLDELLNRSEYNRRNDPDRS